MDRVGTFPEQDTSRSSISPLGPSDVTPSWGRCPSPSHIPITGSRAFSASSRIAQGEAADPNVTLIMDKETLVGVMTGETDGMQAFMGGKLRAEGDMMLALKLGELFPA